MASDEEARRRARAGWPVRMYRLGEEPPDVLPPEVSPEERLAITWRLSLEAWSLTGRPFPDYDRAHIPSRLFRLGEPRPDDD